MFLDEFVGDFYQKLGTDFRANLQRGQVCKAPVLYSHENAEIWRPSRFDTSNTHATDFHILIRPGDAYRQTTTIHSPRLEPYEEFPVVRAKIRPVILLVPDPAEIDVPNVPGGGRINRHLCLAAPCYSVVDAMGKSKYQKAFIDRTRLLEFPQFMFLPAAACMQKDSLLRLDSIQHVFHNHLEATQWALSDDVQKILFGQLTFLLTAAYGGEYKIARDMLMTQQD
jgi:hypothetical protein